jgi:hypothetical protein
VSAAAAVEAGRLALALLDADADRDLGEHPSDRRPQQLNVRGRLRLARLELCRAQPARPLGLCGEGLLRRRAAHGADGDREFPEAFADRLFAQRRG